MFKKQPNNAEDPSDTTPTAKYLKPKILAVDVASDIVKSMKAAGYNVAEGTFGTACPVPRSGNYCHVTTDTARLPDLDEQEILIVDIAGSDLGADPGYDPPIDVPCFWQPCSQGVITPRALAMNFAQDRFNKVFNHAGICIVITDTRSSTEYFSAKWSGNRIYEGEGIFRLSNWGFLSALDSSHVDDESGREIHFEDGPLPTFLRRVAKDATYTCTFEYHDYDDAKWIPLAKNKYGRTVAGLRLFPKSDQYLLLLPRMPKLAEGIVQLLEQYVADWRPDLFPHIEGANWVHRQEYELPAVTKLEQQVDDVQEKAEKDIEDLQSRINGLREENKDWYTLLQGTGDELANAVIRSLRTLGFNKVIDVDEEERKQGNQNNLREDIQIHDELPILVIDVKGINDCPSDDETTQSAKHATMRMREWDHVKVKPLTIVNHQRHLPPLDRAPVAYRPEMVGNAEDQQLGLMTAWDFFRILRNKEHLGWPDETVKPIFYRSGLIRPVPNHYEFIGTVAKAWTDKFGIVVESHELNVGDRVAVEFSILFEEIAVKSIIVDDQVVQHASVADRAGILWHKTKPKIREGMNVYRIPASQIGSTAAAKA